MSVVYLAPSTAEPLEAVVHADGVLLTGLTSLRVRLIRLSDDFVFDWDDGTFKTGGAAVTPLGTLVEVSAAHAPGRYRLAWPGSAVGSYEAVITQTGADADNLPAVISLRVGQLSTTTALAAVHTDVDDLQARLPAALVSGRIDASVGAVANDAITAAAIATDAIDGDAIAASAVTEIQSGLATSAAVAGVPAAVEVVLAAAHGAGSWATATGFTVPGDAMTLTSGERTAVGTAVWATAEGSPAAGTLAAALVLLRKQCTNRLVATAGSSGNLVLYNDDAVTPLRTWSVTDGSGGAVTTPVGSPARRSAAT